MLSVEIPTELSPYLDYVGRIISNRYRKQRMKLRNKFMSLIGKRRVAYLENAA